MRQARAFCLEYGLAMRVGGGSFHADNDLTPAMRVLFEELLDYLAYVEGRIKAVTGKVKAYARCLIPRFDGAILSKEWKEALWDKFVTGAPRPRTPSELQYSDRKLRSRS